MGGVRRSMISRALVVSCFIALSACAAQGATSEAIPAEPADSGTSQEDADAADSDVAERPCIDIRAAFIICKEGEQLTHEGCDGPFYMKHCAPVP